MKNISAAIERMTTPPMTPPMTASVLTWVFVELIVLSPACIALPFKEDEEDAECEGILLVNGPDLVTPLLIALMAVEEVVSWPVELEVRAFLEVPTLSLEFVETGVVCEHPLPEVQSP